MNSRNRARLGWTAILFVYAIAMLLPFLYGAPSPITETAPATSLSRGPRVSPIAETRFTAIVNGHAVECVRRIDHVNHTQSLAC